MREIYYNRKGGGEICYKEKSKESASTVISTSTFVPSTIVTRTIFVATEGNQTKWNAIIPNGRKKLTRQLIIKNK